MNQITNTKNYGLNIKITILIIFIGILLIVNYSHSQSASIPQFLISWQAESYIPNWYQGKNFSVKDSSINIGFELLDNGKIINLSNKKIRWYVNDKLVKNEEDGLGIKFLKTEIVGNSTRDTEIRITVIDYKGTQLNEIVRIPIVRPEAIIDMPYPDRRLNIDKSLNAYPFFFGTKDDNSFTVNWLANGRSSTGIAGDPWHLNLNIDEQSFKNISKSFDVNVKVSVKNFLNQFESAVSSIKLVAE